MLQRMASLEAMGVTFLEPKDLTLTCKGMSSVNWDSAGSDFEFACGEDKVCTVHSVLAEFLSPKIARIRKCDPFYSVYTFKDSEMFSVFQSLVLSLRSGETLQMGKSSFVALLRLSRDLENDELLSSLLGMIQIESMSLDELILLLRVGIDLGTAFSDRFGSLRDFVASHFYELKKEILDNLDLETTQILLSSPSLQIKDEDSLYDFVCSRSENDLRFTSLFEFIYFEYLSIDRLNNFISFVSEHLLENINCGIWRQICRRFILETKLKNPRMSPRIEFFYSESKPLDGMIAHLTRKCGGNVHDKGIVNVTASSVRDSSYSPKHAVDLGNQHSYYSSNNESQSWICYDFKERCVIPKSYSVRAYSRGSGFTPMSWVIEVSNDGKAWTEIDRRCDTRKLDTDSAIANFDISVVTSESFQFFRLRGTEPKRSSLFGANNTLALSALEIFGTLCEK